MPDRHTLAVTTIVAVSKWHEAQPRFLTFDIQPPMAFIGSAYWDAIKQEEN